MNSDTQQKSPLIADKKSVNVLALICALVYFTSYVTRINYGAVVSEIVRAEGIGKEAVSLAVTGLFITYGTGQLISGFLGDRISPKYLMCAGMITASLMNFLLPLNSDPYYMLAVWCVNGFGQALMWPPIVKLMTGYISDDDYERSSVKVSWGSSFGTVAVYLASPVFISVSGWKSLFVFCALLGILGAVIAYAGITSFERRFGKIPANNIKTPKKKNDTDADNKPAEGFGAFFAVLCAIFAAIVLQGTLRDGVTTWMPSYIGETFSLGTSVSILTGVILPIFSIVSFSLTRALYGKFVHNELLLSGIFFAASAAASGILSLFSGASPVLSVLCSTLVVGCMHGINLLLICFVPGKFKPLGNISLVSGILNFATYVGAALSSYGFAALSDAVGWKGTILIWCAVSLLGTLICLCTAPFWRRKIHN